MRIHTFAASLCPHLYARPSKRQIAQAVRRCQRHLALAVSLALLWSFCFAPLALAAAQDHKSAISTQGQRARAFLRRVPVARGITPAPGHLALPAADLTPSRVTPGQAVPVLHLGDPGFRGSLLDSVGRFTRPSVAAGAPAWRAELQSGRPDAARAALLHLWLGEVAFAQDEQPLAAAWHFRQAARLSEQTDPVYGRACYDAAIGLVAQGRYQEAAASFRHLIVLPRAQGYGRRDAAYWSSMARACAGYHADHARLGIPEPPSLDPLCGAAAVAASLQAMHRPFDRKTLLAAMRVTGEGSTLTDIVAAGPKLGVSIRSVAADDKGLLALPKPLVANVEHDHFVSVVRADARGVSYLCSDCGMWPGGRVDLTWAQWHALSPGDYAVVVAPHGAWDRTLDALAGPKASAPVRISSTGSLSALHLSLRAHLGASLPALAGHVVLTLHGARVGCGSKLLALACLPVVKCALSCPSHGKMKGRFAATDGDPVNLATGEEEYQPAPDLTVYNPVGPSVSWQREYRSMRGPGQDGILSADSTYQSDDFGVGWSQSYNTGIQDIYLHDATQTSYFQPGTGGSPGIVRITGTDKPAPGLTWDILLGGSTVATSANPAGWSVTINNNSTFSVIAPASALTQGGYELRFSGGNSSGLSGYFDLTPYPTMAPGGQAGFLMATIGPSSLPYRIEILLGSQVIEDLNSNTVIYSQWVGGVGGGLIGIHAPAGATPGLYTVLMWDGTTAYQGNFVVVPGGAATYAGTYKSLFLPNGAKIPFYMPIADTTKPSVRIPCQVQNGIPYLVEWDYDKTNGGGKYIVTGADRTKWVFGSPNLVTQGYTLNQIIDRNGNAITLNYGGSGGGDNPSTDWPLLSSITNSAGTTLLTISRGVCNNVSQVTDCYGRSVYYAEGRFNTTNTPADYAQFYQELTNVSQVVPTGTGYPPDRWAYGYQNVGNTDGSETVPFLTTIAVPSPAGGAPNYSLPTSGGAHPGVSWATLAYDPSTNWISSITDANGNVYTYTSTGYTSTQVTVSGAGITPYSTSVTYDNNLTEMSHTDGAGHILSNITAFDPNDPYRPASVTDGNGNVWAYTYDKYGHLLTETPPSNVNRTPAVTTNSYSYTNFALGELTQTQQGTKTLTSYTYYDSTANDYTNSGLVQTVNGPLPGSVNGASYLLSYSTYDSLGNPTNIYTLGPQSTPTTSTANVSNNGYTQTTFNYLQGYGTYTVPAESIGQPLTVATTGLTNFAGGLNGRYSTTAAYFKYDGQGNVTAAIDALGHETDGTYTIDNEPLTVALPATGQTGTGQSGEANTYLYQLPPTAATAAWPVATLAYGPLAAATTYDEGNVGAIRQVGYTYGPEDELLSQSGSTEPATYTYDALYRLSTLKDGGNHVTSYFYNAAGYPAQAVYPGAQAVPPTAPLPTGHADTVSFTAYDGAGDLLTRVDGKAAPVTTTYTYNADPESLLTAISYSDGTPAVSLGYDPYGRCLTMNDGTGGRAYTYDDDDDPITVGTSYTGAPSETLTYGYNPDGSRQTMTASGLPGSFRYYYDGLGRMTGLDNSNASENNVATWTYQANGWLQSQTKGSGVNSISTAYTRNVLGEVTDLLNKNGSGTTLGDFSGMTYDGAGSRLTVSASFPSSATQTGHTTYTYDGGQTANPALNRSQLTGEVSTRGGGYSDGYVYDGGLPGGPGNATTFQQAGQTHKFNSDNQLADTSPANWFVYDGDGSPTTYQGRALTYDAESRLTSYAGTALTCGWRGDGLRGWKQTTGTAKTYFLYDGEQVLGAYDSTGSFSAVYTYGVNGLLSLRNPPYTVSNFYAFDPEGNDSFVVTSRGVTQGPVRLDAYGGAGSGTLYVSPDPMRNFGGQWGYYADAGTSLELLGHRFYDRTTGRFLTRDPMGYGGGVNLYGYCRNNPVNGIDPSGLNPEFTVTADGVPITFTTALVPYFPPRNGFSGPTSFDTVPTGTVLAKYGYDPAKGGSEFFTLPGTPPFTLSLPYYNPGGMYDNKGNVNSNPQPPSYFITTGPMRVEAGTAAPAFRQPGTGPQLMAPTRVGPVGKIGLPLRPISAPGATAAAEGGSAGASAAAAEGGSVGGVAACAAAGYLEEEGNDP